MLQSPVTPCICNKKGMQMFHFTKWNDKTIYMGNCIGHSVNGSTTYLAIDDDGQRVVGKKWCLPPTKDLKIRELQLASLDKDFKATYQLKSCNLVPYLAMGRRSESGQNGELCVYVFRDFVVGMSLKCLQDKCSVLEKCEGLRWLRVVGLGVFSALSELHAAGAVHRDVRAETVFLADGGGVRLVGACLDSRLIEMLEGDTYCDRQTKAQDIFAAAQVLLSIVSKETSQEIPPDLPGAAKDFFSRCLTEDELSQWSADQLINHGFLTDAPSKLPSNTVYDDGESESENEDVPKDVQRSTSVNANSRLNDFEILDWLGRGGFGEVLKVQNKLDRRVYALKQVKLDPESDVLNNKIKAEVQLLSRLNHENVVRYYQAWIDVTTDIEGASEEEGDEGEEYRDVTSLRKSIDVDRLVDSLVSRGKIQDESSCGIEFKEDTNKSPTTSTQDVSVSSRVQLQQVLYIQMEFCENNTLRQAIDTGLYQDPSRAWRLFREILEGLAHIHQNDMIHRDLKPDNIFLDLNDNVKIGDFGLATKVFTGLPVDDNKSRKEEENLITGQVGTALYRAPELKPRSKGKDLQKVDMYSLGIILFEMFHPPFDTEMERRTVLEKLRSRMIIMPDNFVTPRNFKLRVVIRWLLKHNANARPTSADLLSSKYIPRMVPEKTISTLLTDALAKRGSRSYQLLVEGCLKQQLSMAEQFSFQSGMKLKPMKTLAAIQDRVTKVFLSHGANEFSPPLLTPWLKRWDQNSNAVKVMTSSGSVCHLPFDLRLPFARYIAHSGTKNMRRYTVGRVYRENKRKDKRCHPLEVIECAFDIVTPDTDTLWPDAELLVAATRAAAECGLKVVVQLNHADLLRSLLLSCGVPLDKHHAIYPVLVDVSLGLKTKWHLETFLTTLNVSPDDMKFLLWQMRGKLTVEKMLALFRQFSDSSAQYSRCLKAMDNLDKFSKHVKNLGCENPLMLTPYLAFNASQYNGVFWLMSVDRQDQKSPKNRSKELVATGGRYDDLVQEFRKVTKSRKDPIVESKSTSVGFSMFLEQMEFILTSLSATLPSTVTKFESLLVVWVWGTDSDTVDSVNDTRRAQMVRELWASGYSCITCSQSTAQAHEFTGPTIVLLPEDENTLVCYWENNRWQQLIKTEGTVDFRVVIDIIKQKFSSDASRSTELGDRTNSIGIRHLGERKTFMPPRVARRAPRFVAHRVQLAGRYRAHMRRVSKTIMLYDDLKSNLLPRCR